MDRRTDPLSGRQVVVAPNRRRRPGAAAGLIGPPTDAELDECPFCEGREDRTPPETFRVGDATSWTARVVPNLYPAFERQEVVIHSPRHVRTLAELTDDEVAATAEAWQERFAAAAAEGFPYVHALVNEGRAAGSSLAHTHSQLVWMREPPPAAGDERGRNEAIGELLARSELAVSHAGGVAAVVHPAGRLPYETLIAAANGAFDLGDALLVLRDVVRRLRAIEGPLPWNAWLHHDATAAHLELVPRLSVLAGVELGAGIYVNTVDPLDAAAALREAAV